MNDKDIENLENPENWDWENAETVSGTKNRRTIVSVAFPRSDFKKVAECARQIGMSVSAFVRHSAVDTAEKVSSANNKAKLISSEPGTYALPGNVGLTTWRMSNAKESNKPLEPFTTDAKQPRAIELISN